MVRTPFTAPSRAQEGNIRDQVNALRVGEVGKALCHFKAAIQAGIGPRQGRRETYQTDSH